MKFTKSNVEYSFMHGFINFQNDIGLNVKISLVKLFNNFIISK